METREFYDVRAPNIHSGLFDLRRWPKQMREGLVVRTNQSLTQFSTIASEMELDEAGYARLPEPEAGPHARWISAAQEVQRTLEIAVGAHIPVLIRVERVYRFNFAAFQKRHWPTLVTLFSQLPGWKGAKPSPHWFGVPNGPPPVLWGTIEPPGLRIRGEIQSGRWAGWDTWLRRNIYEFPLH